MFQKSNNNSPSSWVINTNYESTVAANVHSKKPFVDFHNFLTTSFALSVSPNKSQDLEYVPYIFLLTPLLLCFSTEKDTKIVRRKRRFILRQFSLSPMNAGQEGPTDKDELFLSVPQSINS